MEAAANTSRDIIRMEGTLQSERENNRKLLEQLERALAQQLEQSKTAERSLRIEEESGALKKLLKEQKERVENSKEKIQKFRELEHKTKIELEEKTKEIKQLKTKLEQANTVISLKGPIVDRIGMKSLRVALTHLPHWDRLGSFCSGGMMTLAVAHRWGWDFEVLPLEGSRGEWELKRRMANDQIVGEAKKEYSPLDINRQAYDMLGFFPEQTHPVPHATHPKLNSSKWIEVPKGYDLPAPGDPKLLDLCAQRPLDEGNGYVRCRITFPWMREDGVLLPHILKHGGMDAFYTPEFRKKMRDAFLQNNAHRIKFFAEDSPFNVAMHVRRGDVNPEKYPERWVAQSTFASLARYLCTKHPGAHIHVFSGGTNWDGNWDVLEQVTDTCAKVSFHIDEHEFDTWAHFVAADALVVSQSSTFGKVPAYMTAGEVYDTARKVTALDHWHVWSAEGLWDKKTGQWLKPSDL